MINRDLAYRLLHPLKEGEKICLGVTLTSVEIFRHHERLEGDAIQLKLSSDVQLSIRPADQHPCAFQTKYFNVSIDGRDVHLSQDDQRAISIIKERIEANETEPALGDVIALANADSPDTPKVDLWLVPGHIGHMRDLGFHTLQVLSEVDLIYIEGGGKRSVESIYETFSLGPTPEIVDIPSDPKVMKAHLLATYQSGKTMALFGNNEGAPGLNDPGWQVLQAERDIEPNLVLRTISAGSALTTALMYSDYSESTFTFLGLFCTGNNVIVIYDVLEGYRTTQWRPSLLCFAQGSELIAEWPKIRKACDPFTGRMTLLKNLTRPQEARHQVHLNALPDSATGFISPGDKVVLRIDFDDSWL